MINEISFKRVFVTVLGLYPHKVLVEWELEPTRLDISQYTIEIKRSAHQTDGFKVIKTYTNYTDPYGKYLDYEPLLHNEYREYYYQMIAINVNTGNVVESNVVTWEFEPDYKEMEIISLLDDLLRNRIGNPCILYSEKTVGVKCTECWDAATSRIKRPDCKICSGTGYLLGYDGPLEHWVEFVTPTTKSIYHAMFGEAQPCESDILLSNYPVIKPRDILIEVDNGQFWRINKISHISPSRTCVQQMARVDKINRSEIVYQTLKIPPELKQKLIDQMNYRNSLREF